MRKQSSAGSKRQSPFERGVELTTGLLELLVLILTIYVLVSGMTGN